MKKLNSDTYGGAVAPLTDDQKGAINRAVEILQAAGFANVKQKLRPAFKRTEGPDPLSDWFAIYTVATISLDITPPEAKA